MLSTLPGWFFLALLLTLLLAGVSVFLLPLPAAEKVRCPATRFCLVALRLAIGWHFAVEGLDKIQSQAWTSEGYLRESTGPLAPFFRDLAGDRLIDKLTVTPDGAIAPALADEWQAYLDALSVRYEFATVQQAIAQKELEAAMTRTAAVFTTGKKEVGIPSEYPPLLTLQLTMPERLKKHEELETEIRRIETEDLPQKGRDAFPAWRTAKANLARWRADLKRDLDKETTEMKTSLSKLMQVAPLPFSVERPYSSWTMLDWSDFLVKYGITAVGLCLLVGLLTRTACVVGALYLLLFFLAMPPLPNWPEIQRSEGHYLFINKNIIEMLALLVLATTRSGRWAGLDGLLQFLRPSPRPSG